MALWPDTKIKELRRLWDTDLPAREIAKKLGEGFTKSSVLGKANRLGLSVRTTGNGMRRMLGQRPPRTLFPKVAKPQAKRTAGPPPLPADEAVEIRDNEVVIPISERQTVETLEPHHCRWPVGDPRQKFPDFYFCGRTRVAGLAYCPTHARKAHVAYAPRPSRVITITQQTNKKEVV